MYGGASQGGYFVTVGTEIEAVRLIQLLPTVHHTRTTSDSCMRCQPRNCISVNNIANKSAYVNAISALRSSSVDTFRFNSRESSGKPRRPWLSSRSRNRVHGEKRSIDGCDRLQKHRLQKRGGHRGTIERQNRSMVNAKQRAGAPCSCDL
jgi:hypothetical protein